jgi:VWFA-related protein
VTTLSGGVSRRHILLGTASLLAGGRLLRAQDNPKFSTDVKVVNVLVTVRDKKGNIIRDLTKDDFTVEEEGRPQEIRYFARQTGLPLMVGVIVDMTPSESNMLDVERTASYTFFDQILRPEKDQAFVLQFNDEVELLQDLTSSREKLEKALGKLEQSTRSGRSGSGGGRRQPQGGGANSTALSDAIYLASTDVLKAQKGRKAVIVLGDGDHIGDRQEQAITAAERADTLVYAIRIYDKSWGSGGGPGGGRGGRGWHGLSIPGMGGPGMGGPGMGGPGGGPGGGGPDRGDGRKGLQEFTRRTGGAYFEVTKKDTLEQIYSRIEEELRSQYSLGFTPDANAQPGYRKLRVTTKRKDLVVQGREGYFASSAS